MLYVCMFNLEQQVLHMSYNWFGIKTKLNARGKENNKDSNSFLSFRSLSLEFPAIYCQI